MGERMRPLPCPVLPVRRSTNNRGWSWDGGKTERQQSAKKPLMYTVLWGNFKLLGFLYPSSILILVLLRVQRECER